MTRDTEYAPGVSSSMRRNLKIAVWAGVGLMAAGILLAFAMFFRGKESYDLIPVAVAMISGGPALIAIGLGAKAWQAQSENRATSTLASPIIPTAVKEDGPISPPPGA